MSSIVTFYSYKGGVGRSMALANIAVLLARRGLRVLAVDWDLEAPGLDRYFSYFDIKPGGPGLLRMFMEARDGRPADYAGFASLVDCGGAHPITLLASGREYDDAYSQNLEGFDWEEFFSEKQGGAFIENLRLQWLEEFDIALVDSRTGLSDTGGICTIQIPDIVVAMFTANYQSLYGVRDVMRLAQSARQGLACNRMRLSVLPLPARWGAQEFQETQLWLERVTEALREFYDDWLPRTVRAREVVERIKVPQSDYFGFGEKLAVEEQGTTDPQGMGFIYDKVASFLASDFRDVAALVGRSALSEAETSAVPVVSQPAAQVIGEDDYAYDVFVSHDPSAAEFVRDLVRELETELADLRSQPPRFFVDMREIRAGYSSEVELDAALLRSKVLLAMITPRYSRSPSSTKDYLTFVQREQQTGKSLVVPVIIRGDDFPLLLRQMEAVDLRRVPLQKGSQTRRPAGWRREITRLADLLNGKIVAAPPYDRAWTVASQQPRDEPETSVVPVDLNLIVGDRQTHGQLGPTINMTCRLSNRSPEPLDLHRLAITAAYQDGLRYQLEWHLFYNAFGGEHLQAGVTKRITIGAKSVWQQGVQFHESRTGTSPVWKAGVYHFELLGWLNRAPSQAPNLMTKFRAEVPPSIEEQMMRFQSLPAAQWKGIHDRAVGFPVPMSDISVSLAGSH